MRILIVLAALVFLSSCASSGFNTTAQRKFPRHEGEVEVLRKLPRNGTYDLVGIVTVKGVALTSDERMFDELKEHVKSSIGAWKYPRWIEFVDDLPKTATGKIQRFKLRS